MTFLCTEKSRVDFVLLWFICWCQKSMVEFWSCEASTMPLSCISSPWISFFYRV